MIKRRSRILTLTGARVVPRPCGGGTLHEFNAVAQLFRTAIHQYQQLMVTTETTAASKGRTNTIINFLPTTPTFQSLNHEEARAAVHKKTAPSASQTWVHRSSLPPLSSLPDPSSSLPSSSEIIS